MAAPASGKDIVSERPKRSELMERSLNKAPEDHSGGTPNREDDPATVALVKELASEINRAIRGEKVGWDTLAVKFDSVTFGSVEVEDDDSAI